MTIVTRPKIVNVPNAAGERIRFRVHPDGAVYKIRKSGDRRVREEPARFELYQFAWPKRARRVR